MTVTNNENVKYVYVFNWNPCSVEPLHAGNYLLRNTEDKLPIVCSFYKEDKHSAAYWSYHTIPLNVTSCEWASIPE